MRHRSPYTVRSFVVLPGSQRGAAAIELAFVMLLLLIIVAGIVEFGRAFWYYNALAKGTRDAARFMSNTPNATLGNAVGNAAPGNCGAYAPTAIGMVYCAAREANVSNFAVANVDVACDYGAGWATCSNGPLSTDPVPSDVKVAIVNYSVTIGGMIPFFLPTGGGVTSFTAALAPHTTMRYMR